jgi:uncharacterized protein YjbI with pentapeptide repeats
MYNLKAKNIKYYSAFFKLILIVLIIISSNTVSSGEDEIKYLNFSFSLTPDISTSGIGRAEGLKGLQINATGNIVEYDIAGAQIAGIFNLVDKESSGAQFAGIINISKGDVKGAQFSGIINSTNGYLHGTQYSGIINITKGDIKGAQFAGVINLSDKDIKGAQFAGIINLSKIDIAGAQFAGIGNIAKGSVTGLQASGVFNKAEDITGAQVGIINIAKNVTGAQIGIVNISDDINGAPIGLINIVKDGQIHIDVWSSEPQHDGMPPNVNFGVKLGSKYIYSLLAVGSQFAPDPIKWNSIFPIFGIGGHIPINSFYINIDILSSLDTKVNESIVSNIKNSDLINKLRLSAGWQFVDYLSVFAGASLNVSSSIDTIKSTHISPGIFAGLEY